MTDLDVAVVGAGVAGLMLAKKLGGLGYSVALIERDRVLASGPSTRNEGWLHRGTYHATSILDPAAAEQVARRCIWGHDQIKAYAPEAVESPELPAFAFTSDESRIPDIVERWKRAGVWFDPVGTSELRRTVPEVNVSRIAAAYRVRDVSVNTRILYRRLYFDAVRSGVEVVFGAEAKYIGDGRVIAVGDGPARVFEPRLLITTTGYGTVDFPFTPRDASLRFWKSHLLVTPRLTEMSTFSLDPGVAAMMNHGESSIIGLNEDASLVTQPNFDVVADSIDRIRASVADFYRDFDPRRSRGLACVKIDVQAPSAPRSLNVAIHESPDGISVLPGKMTESPFVTEQVVQLVHARLGCGLIAQRPCDLIEEEGYVSNDIRAHVLV